MAQGTKEFQEFTIGPGVRLFVHPTETFKRTTVAVFFHHMLDPQKVAAIGLLPRVLRLGNEEWPTAMALERELDSLYGTRLSAGVQKTGDRHLPWFVLNLPADRHVAHPVLGKGLHILKKTILNPVVENDGLRADYVQQEKQLQVGRIRALINNKSSYAVFRCIQEMYGDDPFRLHELGTEKDVLELTPQELLRVHAELMRTAPVDVYATGDFQVEELRQALGELLPSGRTPRSLPPTVVKPGSDDARTVVNEEQIGQGWLVLGFRTDVSYTDRARYAMQYLNGILGGFVHSKLFINVREKASLAYQASSGYNASKGYLLALAGIDPAKYEQALEIMLKQVEDIRQGNITAAEMEATRSRLLARTRLAQDDPMAPIMRHLTAAMEGIEESSAEILSRLEAVKVSDVVEVAKRVRLDTIFFLKGVASKRA